ncbi:MAG: class I SAM-dependent methyltransferase, partial [Cryobacterium sp.]
MEENTDTPSVGHGAHAASHRHAESDEQTSRDPGAVQNAWDERYTGNEQLWSGAPNATLVTDTAGLRPARALDVGCGEGADAIWLAEQGWQVTALDVSKVALDRATTQAESRGVDVHWLHAGLVEADLAPAGFDLVSAQYPALFR